MEQLILNEEGQWITPSWARDSDDDEWHSYGWRAWTYSGDVAYRHKEKNTVEQWLREQGYHSDNGYHYVREEQPMNFFFKSPEHKQRFLAAIQGIGKVEEGKIDPEYGAALYILTEDEYTWRKASDYVSRHGIRFEELLAEVDFSAAYRDGLIQLAGNLFNGSTPCSPIDFYRLDDNNFTLALNALQIRRHNWPIERFTSSEYTDAERAEDEESEAREEAERQDLLDSGEMIEDQ